MLVDLMMEVLEAEGWGMAEVFLNVLPVMMR